MGKKTEVLIQELDAMIQHLEDYVLDQDLFKTITVFGSKSNRLIKMTLGSVLERIDELERAGGNNERLQFIHRAKNALSREEVRQPQAFVALLARETKSYTDSWAWFLQNCWEEDADCAADYEQEVGLRLRLEYLLQYGGHHTELADSRKRIHLLDQRLGSIWKKSHSPILGSSAIFPPDAYWWLYGRPSAQKSH